MIIRAFALLLVGAHCSASAPIHHPPRPTGCAVRQVPFTPDSGSIAHPLRQAHRRHLGQPETQRCSCPYATAGSRASRKAQAAAMRNPHSSRCSICRDYTCLPGLIDMHTHLTDRPEDTADLTVYFSRPAEETLRLSKENAAATLLAGFTSVRNVGTYVAGLRHGAARCDQRRQGRRAAHAGERPVSHDSTGRRRPLHTGLQGTARQRAFSRRRRARARSSSASAPSSCSTTARTCSR